MSARHDLIAGRYRLESLIAAGGMGVVWEAWDEILERPVALKQLRTQDGVTDEEAEIAKNRAMREARITARLHHPNAVPVFDAVEHDGRPCLIMQFMPSRPLSAVLREDGPLSPRNAARVGTQIASALAAAHRLGIVHRDVKPGNVLIAEDGTALISDFGISHALGDATLTSTGLVHGTPAFLAPEVARGGESSYASDVFSLGSTLYAAVEGAPPFGQDNNSIAVLHKVALAQFLAPKHSGKLTPLLLDMLDVEPDARPEMAEVAARLRALDAEAEEPATMPLLAPAPGAVASTAPFPTGVEAPVEGEGPGPDGDATPLLPFEAVAAEEPEAEPPGAPEPEPGPEPERDAGPEPDAEPEREAEPEAEAGTAAAEEGETDPAAEREAEAEPAERETEAGAAAGAVAVAAVAAQGASPEPAAAEEATPDEAVASAAPAEEPEESLAANRTSLADDVGEEERESEVGDAGARESLAQRVRAAFAADTPATSVALASPPATGTAEPGVRETASSVGAPDVLSSGAAAPAAPPPSVEEGSRPPDRPDRRRMLIVLLILAALIIAALLALALLPGLLTPAPARSSAPPVHASSPAAVSPSPSASASASPSTSHAPTRSPSPTAVPSKPAPRPASSAPAAASGPPTAGQLAAAISSYYALLPGDTDAAWARLTPRFQAGKAGPRSYFNSFWGGFQSVTASDVSGSAPDTATATIRYVANDGTVSVERDTFHLVRQDGVLKIDSQTTG